MAANPNRIERHTAADPDVRGSFTDYTATMCADLAQMARERGLDTLGYLLDMARLEAENLSRPSDGTH